VGTNHRDYNVLVRTILQESCFKFHTRTIRLLTARTIRTMIMFFVPATKTDIMYLHMMYNSH